MSENNARYYLIGEVMNLTGATREMLRNYERSGLIHPITAGENNYRLYSGDDIRKIVKIGVLDELGLDTKTAKKVTIGRGEMRKTLISNEYDLSVIVKDRADELGKIIVELIGSFTLAKVLEYSILPHFSQSENDELVNFINGIENGVHLSKKYVSAIIQTAQDFLTTPHTINEIIDNLYIICLPIVNLKEKFTFLDSVSPDCNSVDDNELKKYIISFINTHSKSEFEECLDSLSRGLLDEANEIAKARDNILEFADKTYDLIITKYKWIPEKCVPELLSTIYQLIIKNISSTESIFGELINLLTDCFNLLFEEKRESTYYINLIIDYWSNKAKDNYANMLRKGEDISEKTPLYKFFEEMN